MQQPGIDTPAQVILGLTRDIGEPVQTPRSGHAGDATAAAASIGSPTGYPGRHASKLHESRADLYLRWSSGAPGRIRTCGPLHGAPRVHNLTLHWRRA